MSLENPGFVLLIPILYLLLRVSQGRGYLSYSSLRRLPEVGPIKAALMRLPRLMWFLAATFAILGLCHPQSDLQEMELTTQGREMILAVDTSFSMTGHAMEVVKGQVIDFVKKRTNDLIGVTIFGTDAALVVLPTQEYALLENSVKRIKASQVGYRTAVGEGLFTSIMALIEKDMGEDFEIKRVRESINRDHLGDYSLSLAKKIGIRKNRVIVLFTDGIYNVGIDPVRPLKLAARLGIRVHVVAVDPSAETGVEPELAAQRIESLKAGVKAAGGLYFEARDYEEVERFYKAVDDIERDTILIEKVTRKKDLYFYPAMAGLFFLLGMVTIENIWIRIP